MRVRIPVLLLAIALIGGLMPSAGQVGPRIRTLQAVPGGTLDLSLVDKYVTPLVIPPIMPVSDRLVQRGGKNIDYYEIAVRQFQQQILPGGLPMTTVWSYATLADPATLNYPAFTIETQWGHPVRVKWINDLVKEDGTFRPHILPVDQTLHWANPPGGAAGRDSRTDNPAPYEGPVPIVTHVHGAHTTDESDGYAEAWYLPAATDIPAGYATVGSWYDAFKAKALNNNGVTWETGSATFDYPNDQRATTLWYHDHSLGITRVNVYAGPAGFYLIRGGPDDLDLGYRAPKPHDNPKANITYTEIPIAIQDRSFNSDGSLFFPAGREFFDGFDGPYIPNSDISPIWNPEFFGNTMVVNGKTWPNLDTRPQRYRFRFLNGCNSRFVILRLAADNTPGDGIDDGDWTPIAGAFWQIGAEGGFLPAPVQLDSLLIGPAERADVIVDFSAHAGMDLYLVNIGPDEPFGGGVPGVDFPLPDPATTGQVMRFRVSAGAVNDPTTPPSMLTLPMLPHLGAASVTRQVSLNEEDSEVLADVGPRAAVLGTVDLSDPDEPAGIHKLWMDAITENPAPGMTEVWEMYNFTMDAHPIHIHLVQFQVVNREVFDEAVGTPGTIRPPEAWETGYKDTVIAYPGEITRVKARFDLAGLYVWHCHIVDHEDNEMMRPYAIGPIPPAPMSQGIRIRRR